MQLVARDQSTHGSHALQRRQSTGSAVILPQVKHRRRFGSGRLFTRFFGSFAMLAARRVERQAT